MTDQLERAPTVVELEGGFNFRDLGGYLTADGRRVRSGKVYRSGSMHALTEADQRAIASLGIRVVFDLRSNHERTHSPFVASEDWPPVYWARDYAHSSADLRRLQTPDASADHARELMLGLYRDLPFDHADSFRALFETLAAGDLPLVFNCAAGKDRTGAAAILLLDALGVPRETILADYLATNHVRDTIRERLGGEFDEAALQVWAPVFGCEPAYAETLYASIESAHGSFAAYRRDILGLDEALEQRLRDQLLEAA